MAVAFYKMAVAFYKQCWNHDRGSYQQVVGASATDFGEAFAAAFSLVYDLNNDLGEIILLPLRVSIGAMAMVSLVAPPCQPQGAAFRIARRRLPAASQAQP